MLGYLSADITSSLKLSEQLMSAHKQGCHSGPAAGDFPLIFWGTSPATLIKNQHVDFTTTSCKNTWDTTRHLGCNNESLIFRVPSPLPPFSKLVSLQHYTLKSEQQLWMGERGEMCLISHRYFIGRDYKKEKRIFNESVSTFLQLVVVITWKL